MRVISWRISTLPIFCLQVAAYKSILRQVNASLYGNSSADDNILGMITLLKKLCNHPSLLSRGPDQNDDEPSATLGKAKWSASMVDADLSSRDVDASGMHV